MRNSKLLGGIILGISLAVYILLTLLIPFEHNNSFWISFSFSVLAFIIGGIFSFLALNTQKNVELLFSISLVRNSCIYILVQAIISFLIMLIKVVPVWLDVIITIVILAGYLILACMTLFAKNTTSDFEEKVKTKTVELRSQCVRISSMQNRVTDDSIKLSLGKLYDVLRYSDPMGNEQTALMEQDIMNHITELEQVIVDEKQDKIQELCNQLIHMIQERNQLCKIYKS